LQLTGRPVRTLVAAIAYQIDVVRGCLASIVDSIFNVARRRVTIELET
jgi:hypothetical protein